MRTLLARLLFCLGGLSAAEKGCAGQDEASALLRQSRLSAAEGSDQAHPYDAMGKGRMQVWPDYRQLQAAGPSLLAELRGTVTWAVEYPRPDGAGVALCDETRSVLTLSAPGGAVDVPLAPLSNPVGAVFLEGKVYVACFGGDEVPGLAVVDPLTGKLEATYPFPYPDGEKSFVHNVYVFTWDGRPEIFAVILGDPWASPPLPGWGLVRFNRSSGTFVTDTTAVRMNARSAVQQSESVFYVLTQEPPGEPTQLARLERRGSVLELVSSILLPSRDGGDGGADVLLGLESDSVFCTDRTAGAGKLYFYRYAAGAFQMASVRETGKNPRYTALLQGDGPDRGDVVACAKDDAALTIFKGLALRPTAADVATVLVPTVPEVSFFMRFDFALKS